MATINLWLNASYCFVLMGLWLRTGLALKGLLLSTIALLLHLSHRSLLRLNAKAKYLDYALLLVEFVVLSLLSYSTEGESKSTIFLVYTAHAVLNYPAFIAFPLVYTGYLIYMLLLDPEALAFNEYLLRLVNFSVTPLALLGVRLLIRQRQYILELNQRLRSQAQLTAEMIKLKARNELAEAMHDTLGHTLTASIVSLEGVALLWQKRPAEAIALLNSVREQLRAGLGDIRKTVRNLKTDTLAEHATLKDSLIQMVERVNRQTLIDIKLHYEIEETLLPIQDYVLYSVVQESITNVLKHGQANHLWITAQADKTLVTLTVLDDGEGASMFEPGFGLNHLSRKVEALGGTFSIDTQIQTGFKVQVRMPLAVDCLLAPLPASISQSQ